MADVAKRKSETAPRSTDGDPVATADPADLGTDGFATLELDAIYHLGKLKLIADSAVEVVLTLPTIYNKRNRSLLPVALQTMNAINSYLKAATALGLERRARPVPSLDEYLSQTYTRPQRRGRPARPPRPSRRPRKEPQRGQRKARRRRSDAQKSTPPPLDPQSNVGHVGIKEFGG